MSRRHQLRSMLNRRPLATLAIVIAGAAIAAVVLQATRGDVATEAQAAVAPPSVQCSNFFEPEHPLELNTVAVGRFVKSIAMEKEEVRCVQSPSGNTVQIYDVEIFVEIIERAQRGKVQPIEKRVELAVCAKDVRPQRTPPRISCNARDVPLQPIPDAFVGCGWTVKQPRDPVEMNTVVVQNSTIPIPLPLPVGEPLIKTVKVEKELFDCDGPVVEIFLFTEIVESGAKASFHAVSKTFEAILCRKEQATIERAPAVRCMVLPT
jgi:hypothetical protein